MLYTCFHAPCSADSLGSKGVHLSPAPLSSCSSWIWSVDSHTFLFSCIYFSSILVFLDIKGRLGLHTSINFDLGASDFWSQDLKPSHAQSDIQVCPGHLSSSFWLSSSPLPSPFSLSVLLSPSSLLPCLSLFSLSLLFLFSQGLQKLTGRNFQLLSISLDLSTHNSPEGENLHWSHLTSFISLLTGFCNWTYCSSEVVKP